MDATLPSKGCVFAFQNTYRALSHLLPLWRAFRGVLLFIEPMTGGSAGVRFACFNPEKPTPPCAVHCTGQLWCSLIHLNWSCSVWPSSTFLITLGIHYTDIRCKLYMIVLPASFWVFYLCIIHACLRPHSHYDARRHSQCVALHALEQPIHMSCPACNHAVCCPSFESACCV